MSTGYHNLLVQSMNQIKDGRYAKTTTHSDNKNHVHKRKKNTSFLSISCDSTPHSLFSIPLSVPTYTHPCHSKKYKKEENSVTPHPLSLFHSVQISPLSLLFSFFKYLSKSKTMYAQHPFIMSVDTQEQDALQFTDYLKNLSDMHSSSGSLVSLTAQSPLDSSLDSPNFYTAHSEFIPFNNTSGFFGYNMSKDMQKQQDTLQPHSLFDHQQPLKSTTQLDDNQQLNDEELQFTIQPTRERTMSMYESHAVLFEF